MSSFRQQVHSFYSQPKESRGVLLEKSAASAERFTFRGEALVDSVVVRTDLNHYSDWSLSHSISDRVELLDNFFTFVVPRIAANGGVFFRDEGDCIVALFNHYFDRKPTYSQIESYCIQVTSRLYGKDKLSVKTVLSCGPVAIYQKAHERHSDDWSAEGEPFVRAARLEQAVPSRQLIAYYWTDYAAHFRNTNAPRANSPPEWNGELVKLPVHGASPEVDIVLLSRA